jgi:hypothetical protein
MDRLQFFNKIVADVGDGNMKPELDFLDHSLDDFRITRSPLYYRVVQGDMQVPDNIAWKVYQDERLWWVICLVNNINCCADDITVGDLLVIPDMLDIYDFFRRYRKR